MLGERSFDKHNSGSADTPKDLSFDQVLDSMSPKEIRARIRAMAKEEAAKNSDEGLSGLVGENSGGGRKHRVEKEPRAQNEDRAENKPVKSAYDEALETMSPREFRKRMRAVAEEWAQERAAREAEEKRQAQAALEKSKASHPESAKELSFDERLNSMTPQEVRTRLREFAKEEKLRREAELQNLDLAKLPEPGMKEPTKPDEPIDIHDGKLHPVKMTYNKASNSYITEDGYILSAGSKTDRISGYILQDQLNEIARVQESKEEESGPKPPTKQRSLEDQLIDLPAATGLDYRGLAGGVPVRTLYGPGGSSCSEFAVSVDVRIAGFSGGGLTIYDKQNEECQLAQTVQHACAIPELLAMDVQNARNVKEMLLKSDAVATASDFCAETIDAVTAEKARLRKERQEEEDEEQDEPKTTALASAQAESEEDE